MVGCINSEKESLKVDRVNQFLHFGKPRKIFFLFGWAPKNWWPFNLYWVLLSMDHGFGGIILLAFVDLTLNSKEAHMKKKIETFG